MVKHLLLKGRVQGVGFRYFTRKNAEKLNLTGWVKNLASGDVEVYVEGSENNVEKLCERLKHGPPRARVDELCDITKDGESSNQTDRFSIVY